MAFCGWLLSLSVLFSRFTHVLCSLCQHFTPFRLNNFCYVALPRFVCPSISWWVCELSLVLASRLSHSRLVGSCLNPFHLTLAQSSPECRPHTAVRRDPALNGKSAPGGLLGVGAAPGRSVPGLPAELRWEVAEATLLSGLPISSVVMLWAGELWAPPALAFRNPRDEDPHWPTSRGCRNCL